MDIANLSQYGIAGIFIFASWKLYTDMRRDSADREQKLMEHLDKQADTMKEISETLQNMDNRICTLEDKFKTRRKI